MDDGILVFVSQVSILFSALLLTLIYGIVAVIQVLAYGYSKLNELFHTGTRVSHQYRQHLQRKESAAVNKTTNMIGV